MFDTFFNPGHASAYLRMANLTSCRPPMQKIIFAIMCGLVCISATTVRAASAEDFDRSFLIEGTSYTISRHKRDAICFIKASFVNGAMLAIFQFPRGWSLLFTPDASNVWTQSVESSRVALYLDARTWVVNRKIIRSQDGKAIMIDIDGATEASFITDLSRAHDLRIYINGKYESGFSLKGSSRALTHLGHCVDDYRRPLSTQAYGDQGGLHTRYQQSATIGDKLREFFRQ